ncbi:hypothetical protein ACS0TY_015466 [Phlomoides rotata]
MKIEDVDKIVIFTLYQGCVCYARYGQNKGEFPTYYPRLRKALDQSSSTLKEHRFTRSAQTVHKHFHAVLRVVLSLHDTLLVSPTLVDEDCTHPRWKYFTVSEFSMYLSEIFPVIIQKFPL